MSHGFGSMVRSYLSEAVRRQLQIFGIFIDGVEVTQAIQYHRAEDHLTDPADRGPDNSIRLVADKPAYVRVYVRSSLSPVDGVTGTATIQRRRYGIWSDAGTLMQQFPPASVTAAPSPTYATERGSLWNSLNFIIPATIMRGHLRLKVHVQAGEGTRFTADTDVDVDASLLQTLRVRGIPVRYWGPDAAGNQVQLAEPTLADFQTTASLTLRMWPVSQTPDISLAGTFTQNAPLTGAITVDATTGQAQCPQSWDNLLFWLNIAKMIDGNRADRLYYALLPAGIPIGGAGGCGGGGSVGAGPVNAGQTMAHELGHVVQFGHAPCGLVTGDMGDVNYPAYEPYDTVNNKTASIGEYGLDPTTQTLYSPSVARDFMSYCANWISLYHYQSLIQQSLLDPTWVSDPNGSLPPYFDEEFRDPIPHHIPDPVPPWVGRRISQLAESDSVPLVVVSGHVRDDSVEIRSVLRLETGPAPSGEALRGTMVELLDELGGVLERAPLRRMAAQASCRCGGSHGGESSAGIVQALLPDTGRSATLRVVRDGEELWIRQAPSEVPEVRDVAAEVDGDEVRVRWRAWASDEYPTERVVRWSSDDGHTWRMLAIDLREDEAIVPVEMLTSGRVLVQVLVSDGFHSVAAEPVAVDVSRRSPQVAILWPGEGRTVRTDAVVRLWGIATASDGRTLSGDALRWEIDGEPVGAGPEVWAELPEWEGEHRATLRATDGELSAEASVVFLATATGRRPYRFGGD
jgi:hypothetical protein